MMQCAMNMHMRWCVVLLAAFPLAAHCTCTTPDGIQLRVSYFLFLGLSLLDTAVLNVQHTTHPCSQCAGLSSQRQQHGFFLSSSPSSLLSPCTIA